MIVGVVLGGLLGYLLPGVMLATAIVGKLFLNTLAALVIVVIVSSLIVGITQLGDYRKTGRSGSRVLLYYLVTGVLAVAIGLVVVYLMSPGEGYTIPGAVNEYSVDVDNARESYGLYSGIMSGSAVRGLAGGQYLGLIFLVALFGVALASVGVKGRPVVTFFRAVHGNLSKLSNLLFYVAPVGLLSLVGTAVALDRTNVGQVVSAAGGYSVAVVVGLAVYAVVAMPVVLKIFGRRPVLGYFGNLSPALVTAFGTSSSAAALPFTYEAVVGRSRVDQRAGSMALSVGTVLNFGPTAMVAVIAAVFLAQAMGVELGLLTTGLLVLVAMVASIGLAGAPGVISPLLILMFGLVGSAEALSLGVTIVVASDWLLDRLRGVANLCGDAVGAAVVGECFEFKTAVKSAPSDRATRPPRSPARGRDRAPVSADSKADDRKRWRSDRRDRDKKERQARSGAKPQRRSRTASRRDRPDRTSGRRQQKESPFQVTGNTPPALEVDTHDSAGEGESQYGPHGVGSSAGGRTAPQAGRRTESKGGDQGGGRPGHERIKEDLERISTQLRTDDAEETKAEKDKDAARSAPVRSEAVASASDSESNSTSRAEAGEEQSSADKSREQTFPKFDLLGLDRDEEREEGKDDSAREKSAVTYGRSKSRRREDRPQIEPDAPEDAKNNDEAPASEGVAANGNISFGRSKRKRVR
jgi:Na+/H+-dicarboxylate symporter